MSRFIIEGGTSLKGDIPISGSKNAALPLIAASLLVEETTLRNVPRITDVARMCEIIEYLGGSTAWKDEHTLQINTGNVRPKELPPAARTLRASILFAGPLLARFGEAELPYPGGDVIGARPIDSHLSAFEKLGVIAEEKETLKLNRKKTCGGKIVLEETSVTGTENLVMLASACTEETEIRLAAAEPHVQELCKFLQKAGVSISGIGTTTLHMSGPVTKKTVEHTVNPDELEISAFAALAAATHGEITLHPVDPQYLDAILLQLEKIHVNVTLKGDTIHIQPPQGAYQSHRLQAGLYPKLVTDHLPPLAVLATQAEGPTLVHDWLFEARQSYLRELIKMGANVMIMDPHRALVIGPTPLYGKEVVSYDIRSGMAMIIAALVARGTTTITGIEHIDRGYENLEERLKNIGANIERIDS